MTLFSEIKIIGIDTNRPPRVRKESYIDLFYQLSQDAPEEWCDDFASFGRQVNPLAKIDLKKPAFISTYVHDMDAIPQHFEQLEHREMLLARENAASREQGDQQYRLEEIIASLDFDN